MPDTYSKNIVYLSKAQYQELIANQTITVNGTTVTYNENDIYVTPQAEPITDVRANGVSISSNGIANIPIASTTLGLVKSLATGGQDAGVVIDASGQLVVQGPTDNNIKIGVGKRPIIPTVQHKATFYGLATAAGDTTQSQSNNTIGIYTDGAKAAIQNMLGVTDLISTEEVSTATAAHAINSTFMMNGKLHRATAAIAIGDAVEVGTNCEVVKADEVFVKRTDYASDSNIGIVKTSPNYGTTVYGASHSLMIEGASFEEIKAGTQYYKPIVPYRQHAAIFYALSKVAGVDLASETVTLGTYPETSKTAIRSLIGAAAASDIPSVPVQDVQVAGTSALSNGIANIPIANSSTLGVIKIGDGLRINTSNQITINSAGSTLVKQGTASSAPLTPEHAYEAAFYGLAKAAGTDEKDSTLSVGTYTETAKSAIRTMLGAASPDVIAVQDEQPTNADTKVWLPETQATGIQVPTMEDMANYVQKTDYATSSAPGIVQISKGDGIGISSGAHTLYVNAATSALIKAGTDEKRPIVPSNQHEAVFYGLAKVAGDATQAASENAVGTYTTDAKSAIQTMLGIKYTLTVTVLTQDNVTVTNQTVTVGEGGPTGQIYATATYNGQPVSFALPTGFSYYVSVSDTLAHHFNPTTASGIITDADASVTLTYSDFSSIQTAADIKAALNANLDLTDLVGEQISCIWNNSTLVWDVVDYSNDTITLLTHDTLPTQLVFEPVQALMWCENGLAAGSYSFIDGSSTYYFTLTTAIPSGGQLRTTTSTFQTYASMEATATLETGTVSTTEISGATSLGTTASGNLNHMSRVNYGSNNYKESALFQWLNSTEAANIPMPRITKFSRPCTYSVPGFLGALDSSFVAAIDDTTWLCSTNNTYECPTSLGGTVAKSNAYTVTAKVGLASEMEIFGSYGGTADGSAIFDLFNGATADDRKKYQPGTSTARSWWLRSPHWSYAGGERSVGSYGAATGNDGAYNSSGVVPAVKISKTVVSE